MHTEQCEPGRESPPCKTESACGRGLSPRQCVCGERVLRIRQVWPGPCAPALIPGPMAICAPRTERPCGVSVLSARLAFGCPRLRTRASTVVAFGLRAWERKGRKEGGNYGTRGTRDEPCSFTTTTDNGIYKRPPFHSLPLLIQPRLHRPPPPLANLHTTPSHVALCPPLPNSRRPPRCPRPPRRAAHPLAPTTRSRPGRDQSNWSLRQRL